MRKLISILVATLAVALSATTLSGCMKGEFENKFAHVSNPIINISAAGGTKEITIAISTAWEIYIEDSDKAWLSTSLTQGEAGTYTITITVQPNTSTTSRTASVDIRNSYYTVAFSVQQDGVATTPTTTAK